MPATALLTRAAGPAVRAGRTQVDCAMVDSQLSELFGRGQRQGVLCWLEDDDSVLLQNVHRLDTCQRMQLRQLLQDGSYQVGRAA